MEPFLETRRVHRRSIRVPSTPTNDPVFYEVIPETAQPLAPCPPPLNEIATLDEAMKQRIQHALAATRGQIEGEHGAAAMLGINPHTLRARMRKLEINWSSFRNNR